MMDKQRLLRIVNPLLGLAFLFQIISGFAMKWDGDRYEQWGESHEICGWLLIALLVAHLWLNWGWIKSNVFKLGAKKPSAAAK